MVEDPRDRHWRHLQPAQTGGDGSSDVAHLEVPDAGRLADALDRLLGAEEVSVGVRGRTTRAPARKYVVAVSREGLEQLQDGDRLGRQRNDERLAGTFRRSASLLGDRDF